jgi:hypothetical protein
VYGAIAIPLVTGTSIVLGVLVGDPTEGVAAAAVGLAGVGAALAMGNIFTVALAYPMKKRAGNPMPQPSQGYNGYAIAAVFGTLASVAAAVIPVIILANLTSGVSAAMRLPVLFGCAAAYGLLPRLARPARRRYHGRGQAAGAMPGRHAHQPVAPGAALPRTQAICFRARSVYIDMEPLPGPVA